MSDYEPFARLQRDIKLAAADLDRGEARSLVEQYYSVQNFRIHSGNLVRASVSGNRTEPHSTLLFFYEQWQMMEKQIQSALDTYSKSQPLGAWAREHTGVGPVIAAGLLAHIDVTKAPYASSIWRFAGLLPGQKLVKGQKRDWNADLKVLCWKLGDSFVKQSGRESCYYGRLYRARKELEVTRDQQGMNKEQAKTTLEERKFQDQATKVKYESGHLPDGRLDMRARRYAVKRFLVHYFEQAWWFEYGTQPPNPWIQEHGGHVHIEPSPVPYIKHKL